MALTGVEVEFCQTIGSEERHQQSDKGGKNLTPCRPVASAFSQNGKQDESRCHTAGHHVGQRIEFLTQRRSHIQQTGSQAIEEVEEDAKTNKISRPLEVPSGGIVSGNDSAEQIAEGDEIGNLATSH